METRFKTTLSSRSIAAGREEIRDMAAAAVAAFERILAADELGRYRSAD